MDINLDDAEVAVSVEILRGILNNLSVNGKTWCIACETAFAFERGYVPLGFGCRGVLIATTRFFTM